MYTYSSVHTRIPPLRSSFSRQTGRRVKQLRQFCILIGPKILWSAVGRVALVFSVLSFAAHFWLSSTAEDVSVALQEAENGRCILMDENVQLRAERARLISPAFIDKKAAGQLALHVPERDQVTRF